MHKSNENLLENVESNNVTEATCECDNNKKVNHKRIISRNIGKKRLFVDTIY